VTTDYEAGKTAVSAALARLQLECRICGAGLGRTFVDLGMTPLANAYVAPDALLDPETFFPLHAFVCEECLLVQLPAVETPEHIFDDYAYFSSYSDSWLDHARRYVDDMSERFAIDERSSVVEVASNDGYPLQYFKARGVPVLGIEPAANVAVVAEEKGIPTVTKFLGAETAHELARDGVSADLLIGNNVLAHVPDLNDFVRGLARLLAPTGLLTMEFPHLLRLMRETQFDTIYHEHFSYFSLLVIEDLFARHGMRVVDVDELPTHGGSLRIYVRHEDAGVEDETRIADLRAREADAGLDRIETYERFAQAVRDAKIGILDFVLSAKRDGKTIVGYGAAAKGNTLLSYCGIGPDLLDYVVDRSPHKQGLYLPGTHIPILAPEKIDETRPDYLLILPWNLKDEIMEQMAHVRSFGCRFVIPVPEVSLHG
jgi:SAM-dependent methyltransferase